MSAVPSGIEKPALSGLPLNELATMLAPLPRFRAAQVFKWLAAGVSSFEAMSNLPRPLREELAGRFLPRSSAVEGRFAGADGTVKLQIGMADGAKVEAVLLTDGERRTACLSTQAGCPAGCVFCKTGHLGFLRDLSSAEIVEQFLLLRQTALEAAPAAGDASPADAHAIDNIVVMGMGEPLLNLAELRRALAVVAAPEGMNFSKRRITVSTCGISEGIASLAENGPAVRLALSLTTADEALRRQLMPIAAAQPLAEVKKALMHFQRNGGGRVTLEAVLLGGINTRPQDAAAFAEFARGLDAAANLIPWNPVAGLEFAGKPLRPPSAAEAASFAAQLKSLGLNVTRRFRRGRGVTGACGQLGVVQPVIDRQQN